VDCFDTTILSQLTEITQLISGQPLSLKRRKPSVITLADRARDAGQWELAAQLYRKALNRNPRNLSIWVQYGHALKERGSLTQAETAYRMAIAYQPGSADSNLQLGHALKIQGKQHEAQAAYLRALALEPFLPHPLRGLGELGWSKAKLAELQRLLLDRASSLRVGGGDRAPITVDPSGIAQSVAEQHCAACFDGEWYLDHSPDVAHAEMNPPEHFLMYGLKEGRNPNAAAVGAGSWRAVTDAEIHCLLKPSFRNEVALFVTHSPHGRLKPHVRHYLDSLKRQRIAIILIVATDRPFTAADVSLINSIDGMFVRRNEG